MDQGSLTHSELRSSAIDYVDEWGFVTTVKYPPLRGNYPGGGNVILYGGLYYSVLAMKGALLQSDCDNWVRSLMLCRHEEHPIFWRSPVKKNADDNQEHDDYWAIIATCYHARAISIVERILEYAERSSWCFDIQRPGEWSFKYFFWRFLPFAAFTKYVAGRANALDKFVLCACSLFKSATFSSGGSAMRAFLIASVLRDSFSLPYEIFMMRGGVHRFEGELPPGHPLLISL